MEILGPATDLADPLPPAAGDWLKRLLLQLLDRAAFDVDDLTLNPARALHRLRLRMKKAEALLKLSKGALGKPQRWRLRKQMRAIKNSGGGQRDAEVVAKLARELGPREGLMFPLPSPKRIRPNKEKLKALVGQLRLDLSQTLFDVLTWDDVRENYAAGYNAGRRCMEEAEHLMTAEAFHRWRKRVKATRYQTQALAHRLPHPRHRLQRTRKLAKLLGRDHDLTLLVQETEGRLPDNPWVKVVEPRLAKLRPRVIALGAKIYGASSHRFARLRPLQA